jgi:GDPmannose 4,6-dehydratase
LYITWSGEGLNEVGIDQYGITRIKINPRYYRPCEVDLLLGDVSKAEAELNWSCKYQTLDELITSMFEEK